jgi:signal transduction histidine kinase
MTKRTWYRELFAQLEALEQKQYIAEVIEKPAFRDGQQLYDTLQAVCKAVNDELAARDKAAREYREYVELWVHEIKTPLAAAAMLCETNGCGDVARELGKIESFVEQALFYARSNVVEKDFLVKELNMEALLHGFARQNARLFIWSRVQVEIHARGIGYGDPKWLHFILRQLVENAMKYGAKKIILSFENNILSVRDDGIGIPPQDLPRVFNRGFTGENGRKGAKSTGMGLYLCKKLCDKLGLQISAESQGQGAEFRIAFPENPFVTFS